ncbi:hypothetical protein F0919_08870 [Taibaiella lutea]|uniref:Lipoprotein n=1 Tax=Taibaiella lutea TaxID=2608001 RepID=A0A5M6CI80_9BACT|nr:hypothetical protein [Taibaiella lutea]KAA5534716.1 hypothetical protein F0919_08870 [Taibaiella lutea]
MIVRKPNIAILLPMLFLFAACNDSTSDKADTVQNHPDTTKKITGQSGKKPIAGILGDFVISCGGGCAMTYHVKSIETISPATIKVIFEVEQYIDEAVSETFDEAYVFHYGNINTIERLIPGGKHENISEILMPDAQQSFKDFASRLIEVAATKKTG